MNPRQEIEELRQSILGVANTLGERLEIFAKKLGSILDSYYEFNKKLKVDNTANLLVGIKSAIPREEAKQMLDEITKQTLETNKRITELQVKLQALTGDTSVKSTVMKKELEATLANLNEQNAAARKIQTELKKHPMLTGKIPENVTTADVEKMLKSIESNSNELYKLNSNIKQQLAQSKLAERGQKEEPVQNQQVTSTRKLQ